jgi:hypothetical protein
MSSLALATHRFSIWFSLGSPYIPAEKDLFELLIYDAQDVQELLGPHCATGIGYRICNTYDFPRQQWLRKHASILHFLFFQELFM